MTPTPREIHGNYSLTDAMYVDPAGLKLYVFTDQLKAIAEQEQALPKVMSGTAFDAHLTYVRCIRDDNRPFDHQGDWPEAGQWYLTRPVESRTDGVSGIRIIGFEGNHPYYNSFALDRFDQRGLMPFMCLN